MNGPLLNEMREQNRLIIESGGYQTNINLVSSTNPVVDVTITGESTFHNLGINPETGQEINSKQIHAIVNIQSLLNLGYPVYRDNKLPDNPDLLDDLVFYQDSSEKIRKLKVIDQRPDLTFGCILLFFEEVIL